MPIKGKYEELIRTKIYGLELYDYSVTQKTNQCTQIN